MSWSSRFDEVHERAAAQAGLSDFGDTDYHEGCRVLLEALDDNSPEPGTRENAEGQIIQPLVSRLRTQQQWKANPGYAKRGIPAPLIVIGMPRTGTTALHNLLSQDPQFQGIEKWITGAPIVRPPREEWDEHPQYQAAAAAVAQMTAIAPDVMTAHGVYADEVDECLVPMAQSFTCNWFPSTLDVPLYDRWLLTADETPSYRRYKDVLRLVGMRDERRWLLKNPSHVFGIGPLLEVFPDACVVQTHRHPVASLASLVNLLDNIIKSYTGEGIDRPRRLAREAAFWAEAMRRTMAAQDKYPGRIVNVRQGDIRKDPIAVVHRIYDHFGISMSSEAEARFQAWAAENPPEGKSAHAYEAIADQSAIEKAFEPYIERYAL